MGLTQFEILFDNPVKSYFPGQEVTGRVVVVLDKEKIVKGLKIKFLGKASVHWTETERVRTGDGDDQWRTETRTYQDTENFFDHKYYATGEGEITLPPGLNEYPFRFSLPPGLPSSYKGAHGSVTYEVQAVMKRSWKFDHDTKQNFTINAIADLNTDPIACQPAELRKSKTLCCLCCRSGSISLLVKLPRKGYVAGEYIALTAEINNMSNTNIYSASISLVQISKFHAQGKTKESTNVLIKVKRAGIDAGDSDIWQGNLLQVPSVPPTRLGNCRIIDVQYILNIELVFSGISSNLKVSIPIVIGTIPLRAAFAELMPQNNTYAFMHHPFPPSAPLLYPDSPPPDYQEAFNFGQFNPVPTAMVIDQAIPQQPDYAPKYVTYGWNFPVHPETKQ